MLPLGRQAEWGLGGEEKQTLAPALELLDDGADLTTRKEFRGHATAGAILADPDGRILHIRHLALDRWLLSGRHLEASDAILGPIPPIQ
ncbi:hypothetical protein ACFQVD_41880 [Streptosporangium amethystogenes subsp. fukuiense]|uniref:NUDIX hydrolase n=1 Tax=Streptosporangium amethystogenes subsp. fukuiense TaxID=698418 RepID=A0ABW2TEE3_9ACTN